MIKMRKFITPVLLGMSALVLGACGEADTNETEAGKVAYVTGIGGLGDGSFNDLGYAGVQRLMDEGIQVDVSEPTSLADIEGIIGNFANSGEYELIVSMGGDSVDFVNSVSEDYPDQPMLVIDGLAGNDNVKSVLLSQSDATFVLGAYAALMQKEGLLENAQGKETIGVVGGMDIPIIRSAIAGYMAGAKYINPEIDVLVTYVGGWNDPGTGAELARTMINQGADVIYSAAGASGLGALEATAEEGLYGIGYDGNQNGLYPDSIIVSGYRGTANVIYTTAKDAINGEFVGGDFESGIQDDIEAVQITVEESNIATSQEILDIIETIKEKLHASSEKVPDEIEKVDAFLGEFGYYGN